MITATPKMNLVVLRSKDIDRATNFYGAMGLSFTKHRHGAGPEHGSCVLDGLVFEIYPGEVATTATRIGFSVGDVDAVFKILVSVGATVVLPPSDSEWGRRAVVRDLDGHSVELLALSK